MCTAMRIGNLFGRTLDLEYTYNEQVVLTPRQFPLAMRHWPALPRHHAILGMATVADGFPLYYDALNEQGLAMAGLNFPHSGVYAPTGNMASFELIPYLLGTCADVAQAKAALAQIRVCNTAFSADFPPTRLHWMVADATTAIVVETTAEGMRVYDNPVGAMTNEPPFPDQLAHWRTFRYLTAAEPSLPPPRLGRGSGSVGLPGDFTSPSRFVRAAFVAANSAPAENPVGQFFEAMATVAVPRGCVRLPDGGRVITQYTACMDLTEKAYCYRTYGCPRVCGVRLGDPDGDALRTYPLPKDADVEWEN